MKRVAIVGFGFMGSMHAQVYQQLPDAEVVAIADARTEQVTAAARKLELAAKIYPDLPSLLDAEQVDAVDICLPTDLHHATTLLALDRGKHVFCEKPIARSLEEAEDMTNAAKKKGAALMIGQCIRFWPEYVAFEKFVRSEQAGRLLSLNMQRRTSRPLGSSDNWMQDESRSLGCVVETHIHDTDFVHHLLGRPKAVYATGTRDYSGWAHIFAHYEFPDVVVMAEGGWDYPAKWGFQMAFQAVFEQGTVEFDSRATPTLTCTLHDRNTAPMAFEAPAVGPSRGGEGNISSLGGYFNELAYFIECLEKGREPEIATGAQATDSLRTALAEVESCVKRQRIAL